MLTSSFAWPILLSQQAAFIAFLVLPLLLYPDPSLHSRNKQLVPETHNCSWSWATGARR